MSWLCWLGVVSQWLLTYSDVSTGYNAPAESLKKVRKLERGIGLKGSYWIFLWLDGVENKRDHLVS